MGEQHFFIKGCTYSAADPQLQKGLAWIYEMPERPRCMCMRGGVEMYVAKHRLFVVKRMPGSIGRKIWIKHIPDAPLIVDTKAWERLERVHGKLFQARNADTARKPPDTVSLMLTAEHWVPIVHLLETIDTRYSDGGRALQTIFDTTAECVDAMERLGLQDR